MPYYEYRCKECGRGVRLFYSYDEYDSAKPICSHCGSAKLIRIISRVALAKSEDSRLDSLDPESMMAGLDEDDPKSMGRFMRKMSQEMGEDMGDEFDEIVDRLESGESPERIEESMPDAAGSSGESFGGDGLI
jgi:putative FmdB family regulatory protein